MSARVRPELLTQLKKFGEIKIEACFNCGNCTAICPLTSDQHPFPRNVIRLLNVGLKDKLLENVDPWLCYYCGECTQTCPREAEPAEAMMTLRRWLTAQYDRSGHGAKLYTSEKAVVLTILRLALITLALFVVYHAATGFRHIGTNQVALNDFAPVFIVWALVIMHFAMLGFRLFSNIRQMFRFTMKSTLEKVDIPISLYLSEIKTFVIHLLTQKRWRDCEENHQRWLNHLILISGYGIMLILVVGLLGWFQTDNIYPYYHPQRWLGYYATLALMYGSIEALVGRMRKKDEMHHYSHPTDWLFPTFILVGAVTGILVHIFRYLGWPWPTYGMYVIHLMAMVAMLDTEVGIGKWTHLFYRPLAMYLSAIKEKATEIKLTKITSTVSSD
jgi:ferredoxin